jgi:hypothetical protein
MAVFMGIPVSAGAQGNTADQLTGKLVITVSSIMEYFLRNFRYVLSRDALLNTVWEYNYMERPVPSMFSPTTQTENPVARPPSICVCSLGYPLRESLDSVF